MSFNVNTSSYSSYANGYSAKTSKLETMAGKSSSEIISNATMTIQKNGKTYYVVNVEGEAYLYDSQANSWTKKSDDKTITYNTNSNSLSVTDKSDKRTENYNLNSSNTGFDFVTAKKDNNIYQQNIAIIDDFTNNETVTDSNGYQMSIGQTHGSIGASIIEASGGDTNAISYDATLNKALSVSKLMNSLNDVQTRVARGEDIDAVNLSMSVVDFLTDFGFTDLNSSSSQTIYNKIKSDSSYSDIVSLIDKIKEMADSGISFYIASGNEANDDYTKNYSSSMDKNHDGKVTGDEVGAFNLLTLANSTNVHTIGATDNMGNLTDYSNNNSLVDELYDGQVDYKYLSNDSSGNYYYDIDGDGKSDVTVKRAVLDTSRAKMSEFDINGDNKVDYYGYDIDGDGVTDFRSLSKLTTADAIENSYISKLKSGFFITGTSFSTPLAAQKNDAHLA